MTAARSASSPPSRAVNQEAVRCSRSAVKTYSMRTRSMVRTSVAVSTSVTIRSACRGR